MASKQRAKIAKAMQARADGDIQSACGRYDCGSEEHYAAVSPESVEGVSRLCAASALHRGIGLLWSSGERLRGHHRGYGVNGGLRVALYQKLEAAASKVFLVNARHLRHVRT